MSLFEEYNDLNPNFIERLNAFGEEDKNKFLKKLRGEEDELIFLSTISEFLFFEYFLKEGYVISYEKKYKQKKQKKESNPDLTVNKFEQDILVEILKLNPTKKDIQRNSFIQCFFKKRTLITEGYNLEIKINNSVVNFTIYNKENILKDLSNWLSQERNVFDIFKISENLEFEILAINTGKKNIGFYHKSNIQFDIRRLTHNLKKKINQHIELLKEINIPYIICLHTIIDTAINEKDVFWKIYGDLVFNRSSSIYYSELNGLFYSVDNAKKYLSGLLLMINEKCFYFHNFLEDKLNAENKDFLSSYQYYLQDTFPSKQV